MKTVTVIDYGLGNIHSVVKALHHRGASVEVTDDVGKVRTAERVVLPGVAAFGDGIRLLNERGLAAPIYEFIAAGRPFLGICLGMQMLMSSSEEFGQHTGLGVIAGRVEALRRSERVKVPHVGWNALAPATPDRWRGTLFERVAPMSPAYFVHSFTAVPADERDRLADTYNGDCRIAAAIQRDNVIGCQFHPEKSGPVGLMMIDAYLAL
jgi:glutamine amidotransferase